MINTDPCVIPKFFSYFMMIYLFASVYYFVVTRVYGTPFSDELKKPQYTELREIQKKSSEKRGRAFMIGLVLGTILVFIFQPFSYCF